MTSKLKCPFCNSELVGTIGHPICRNQDCVMCDDPMPQDLLEELIRTRKDLEIVTEALEKLKYEYNRCRRDEFEGVDIDWEWWVMAAKNVVETALKQIEHKENQ